MSRIINGTLYVPSYEPLGGGRYSFTNAQYRSQTDLNAAGVNAIEPGFVLYVPAVDAVQFLPIPGTVHRYRLETVEIVDAHTINGTMVWDETGPEIDYPAANSDATISAGSPNYRLGLPIDPFIYATLPVGAALSAYHADVLTILDNLSQDKLVPATDVILGGVKVPQDSNIVIDVEGNIDVDIDAIRGGASPKNVIYVATNGSDEEGLGTISSPFQTIAFAVQEALETDVIVVVPGVYNEQILIGYKNVYVTGMVSQNTTLDGVNGVVLNGKIQYEGNKPAFFANINVDSTVLSNVAPVEVINVATGGMLVMHQVGLKTAGDTVNVVALNAGGLYDGKVILNNVNVSNGVIRVSDGDLTIRNIANQSNASLTVTGGTVRIYGAEGLGKVTHANGKVYLNNVKEIVPYNADPIAIASSAEPNSALLYLNDVSLSSTTTASDASNYRGHINKTGNCPYVISNVTRNPSNDVLTGNRLVGPMKPWALDVPTGYTPNNYTAGRDTMVTTHLSGIDARLGAIIGMFATKYGSINSVGTGYKLFPDGVTPPNLVLKSIRAGTSVSLTDDGSTITINADVDTSNVVKSVNSFTGDVSLVAGTDMQLVATNGTINIHNIWKLVSAATNGTPVYPPVWYPNTFDNDDYWPNGNYNGNVNGMVFSDPKNANYVKVDNQQYVKQVYDLYPQYLPPGGAPTAISLVPLSSAKKVKGLAAGQNITFNYTDDAIIISSTGGGSGSGNVVETLNNLKGSLTLLAGTGIAISTSGTNAINISNTGVTSVTKTSTSGTTLVASTGVENGVATIKNIVGGAGIVISQDANTVTITSTAASGGTGGLDAIQDAQVTEGIGLISDPGINTGIATVKKIVAGTNVELVDTTDTVTVNVDAITGVLAPEAAGTVLVADDGVTSGLAKIKNLVAGTNIQLTDGGDTVTISSTAQAGDTVSSVNSITGDITIAAGSNVEVTTVGNTITIASTGGSSEPITSVGAGTSIVSDGEANKLKSLVAGDGISITSTVDTVTITNTGSATGISVNGVSPDESGNIQLQIVSTVNGVAPSADGTLSLDVGVKTINGNAPGPDGNIDIQGGGSGEDTKAIYSVNGIEPVNHALTLTAGDVDALPITGGMMEGPIDMNSNTITGLPDPVTDSEPVTLGYLNNMVIDGGTF